MAWTAPATVTAGQLMTAAFWNTHVRDNFLVTAPAVATTAGGIFVATAANAVAERIPAADYVATSQGTASTSYTDLATAGPAVTVTTGTKAIVHISALMFNSANDQAWMSPAVSSATTIAAADATAMSVGAHGASVFTLASKTVTYGLGGAGGALTAGSNVFTMKYKANANTSTFEHRELVVFPL